MVKKGLVVLVKTSFCIALLPVFLMGCAGPEIKSEDAVVIEQSRAASRAEMVRSKQDAEVAKYKMISTLPKDQVALVFMADAMKAMAEANKKSDSEMGLGYFDYATEVAKSQNETISRIVPGLVTATATGFAIHTTGKVLEKAFDSAGNKTVTNINGDGNNSESKIEETRVNNHVNTTTTGDDSPANSETTSTATGQNPTTTNGTTTTTASGLDEAIASCEPSSHTQGEVAVCLTQAGYDVDIEGGITYVDGEALEDLGYKE